MKCNKCGNELQNGAKFCAVCGAPVETPVAITSQNYKCFSNLQKAHIKPKMFGKKKLIIIIAAVVIGLILISGIGHMHLSEKSTGDYNGSSLNNDNTDMDEAVKQESENDNIEFSKTEDGEAYVLENLSPSSYFLYPCYNSSDDTRNNAFCFIWKNTNESIPKLNKKDKVGIYKTLDEVELIRVDEKPNYTVAMNFIKGDGYPKAFQDDGFGSNNISGITNAHNNIDFDVGNIAHNGNPITECNEKELNEFIDANCDLFFYHEPTFGYHSDKGYKLLNAKKNEKFVFGGYVGTSYESFEAKATVEYYKILDVANGNETAFYAPVNKTKNGYFEVDLSEVEPGIYFATDFYQFVELI